MPTRVTKQWKHKETKEETPKAETSKVEDKLSAEAKDDTSWTTIEKSRRGKKVVQEDRLVILLNQNYFDSLNLLNEGLVMKEFT